MDTLTHVLSGSLTGRSLGDKVKNSSTKAFIFVGALAALFPDLDIVLKFISDEIYLLNHRGFSHSFFYIPIFAIFISAFCAWIFSKKIIFKNGWIKDGATFKGLFFEFYLIALLGLIIHVCGDIITSFGTMFLYPFSNTRFEAGSVFIIDLIFTGIIIAGLIFSAKQKEVKGQVFVGRLFMGLLLVYVAFTQILKFHAVDNMLDNAEKIISKEARDYEWKSVPQMLNPFNWLVIGHDKENNEYHLVKMNVLNSKDTWTHKVYKTYGDVNPERAEKALKDPAYKDYVWFLMDPVYHSENAECVYFQKAQNISKMRNPFVYGFCEKDGNKYIVRQK